jgi:hypothetical protein
VIVDGLVIPWLLPLAALIGRGAPVKRRSARRERRTAATSYLSKHPGLQIAGKTTACARR